LARGAGSWNAPHFDAGPDAGGRGYIHCSYAHQVAHVAATYFHDMDGLLVLVTEPQRVNTEIRHESAGGDERFPHIYGPLNLDAIIETRPVGRNSHV
jgi:uncharacterized protein (DUF952 family)